jgi:hypothetical protein
LGAYQAKRGEAEERSRASNVSHHSAEAKWKEEREKVRRNTEKGREAFVEAQY